MIRQLVTDHSSLVTFLFWFAWVAATPTLLFAGLWVASVVCGMRDARSEMRDDPEGLEPPSMAEADEILEDELSPDCSPLNAARKVRSDQ